MRFRSLGHLAGGLLALTLASSASSSAQEPEQNISCIGGDTSGDFEIGIVMDTPVPYTIVMFDMMTGLELSGSRQIINSATLALNQCHYRAYGGMVNDQGDPAPVLYQNNRLYRIDMFPASPSSTLARASFYTFTPNDCVSSVFCPIGNVFPDMVFFIDPNGVQTYPAALPGGFGTADSVEDYFAGGPWVLPYDTPGICPKGVCSEETDDGYIFVTPAPFGSTGPATLPVTLTASNGADWRVPAGRTYNWSSADVSAIRYGIGGALTVKGALNVSGVTLTAANPAAGWNGVRFNAGSNGTWTNNTTVERVVGGDPFELPSTAVAVRVTDASPTFTDVTIKNAGSGSAVDGLYVTGSTAAPVTTNLQVENMSGSGVVSNGGARVDLVFGTVTTSVAAAVTASGTGSRAYLRPDLVALRGPQLTGNFGAGVVAAAGSVIRFGTDSPTSPGYGYGSVTGNGGRGLTATGGADIYAGSGTVGSGMYQRNRVFGNGASSSPTGNGLATGTGSTIYARCNWWGQGATPPFRTGQASGGLVDVSYHLTGDPYQVTNPPCVATPQIDPGRGLTAEAGRFTAAVSQRSSVTALDRLAEAMTAETPSEAVALLAALVEAEPDTEEAAAALGEAGAVAGRPDTPPTAVALLESTTTSGYAALRVAAWQALVASRRAQGDRAGALAAADALGAEGGPALVQAEVARVYLYGEDGQETAAVVALESLESLAPGSVEAGLAREFLGLSEAPTGGRGAGAPVVEARGTAATEVAEASESVTLAIGPNPAAGAASVSLTLREAADITVVVYDLLGRAVATPLAGAVTAGTHRAALDGSRLAPGVYVVRATVNTAAGAVVRATRLTVTR